MNAAQSIVELFEVIEKLTNSIEAKEAAATAIYNVISDLQEQNLPITEENITQKLHEYCQDFVEVSKKNQVA